MIKKQINSSDFFDGKSVHNRQENYKHCHKHFLFNKTTLDTDKPQRKNVTKIAWLIFTTVDN